MKKFRSVIVVLLAVLLLTVGMATPVSAAVDDGDLQTGLYPEEKTDKSSKNLYDRYPIGNYELTYISSQEDVGGKECDDGIMSLGMGCEIEAGLNGAVFKMTEGIWWLYLVIAKWLISVISWGFTMQVLDYMFNAYSATLQGMQKTLWDPFKYLMWSVAVAWMVYYWITNKTTRLWSTLINSLIIIALSATVLGNLPNFIRSLSTTFTDVSVLVLSGLSDVRTDNPTEQKPGADKTDQAVDQMKDDLFNFAIVIPYKMVQFGSVPLSQQTKSGDGKGMRFWEQIVSKDSSSDRDNVITDFYDEEDDKDKAKGKYAWFTKDKVGTRLAFTALTFFASLACLLCFVMISFYVIMWQLIALGRGLLTAIYFLLALWPEWGIMLALQHLWKVIQAEGMRLWYTIFLATFINLEMALAEHAEEDNIGMLSIWLIALGLYLGLKHALDELRSTLNYIPLGNGRNLEGVTDDGEKMGNQVAGAALMAAGAVTGTGAVIGAGLAMQQGGMGNIFKTAGLGAVSKVGGAMSSVRKGATSLAGKGAMGLVKGSGSLAGKAANWVDDNVFHGKVKQTTAGAIDKAKELANKGIGIVNKPLEKAGWRGIKTLMTDRLTRQDKQLMNDAKQIDGLDLKKRSDRVEYAIKHPEQRDQIIKLEEYYNKSQRVAKKLPKVLPAKNSPEYGKYVEQYGEDVLDSWTSARVQQRSAKQANRNRPLKERVQPKSFAGENSTRASTSMMNAFENNMSSRAVNSGHRPSLNNMNLGRQGGALPQYVQTSVQNAITTQIRGADIKIDTKEIADAIRQQMSTQFQNIMNGNTRGDKKNIRVELRDNRNRAQHVNVPVADLQTAYAKSNPVAVQMMQTTNAIGFAKTVSGANSTSEVNRVLNSFRAEVHQAVAHVQSGGDIEKFKGIERIERLYPELKSLSSNMKKFEQIGKMLSETGSPLTLEQMAKFFEDSSRNIRPSTPK